MISITIFATFLLIFQNFEAKSWYKLVTKVNPYLEKFFPPLKKKFLSHISARALHVHSPRDLVDSASRTPSDLTAAKCWRRRLTFPRSGGGASRLPPAASAHVALNDCNSLIRVARRLAGSGRGRRTFEANAICRIE